MRPPAEQERLYTPAEVARMFRVDPKTVTRWAKAGKLTAIRTLGRAPALPGGRGRRAGQAGDGADAMSAYTKADLDAMTDRAAQIIRDAPFTPGEPRDQYARSVAEMLAVQFPDVAELPRIALACSHWMSALADAGCGSATLVHVLGDAALRIGDPS